MSSNFIASRNKLESKYIEFKFYNLTPYKIDIYYDDVPAEKDLKFIVSMEPQEVLYIYPKVKFVPSTILYTKYNNEYILKPYVLKASDYNIYFGQFSSEFGRTSTIHAASSDEISSLLFINHSVKPFDIFYKGKFLGRVEGYHPTKIKNLYTLFSMNFGEHFMVGDCIEFRMGNIENPKFQKMTLLHKKTTTINVFELVGTSEYNR